MSIPSKDGGEIDAVDAQQRWDQCKEKTSREGPGIKPRIRKQRIASYNRKEARERVLRVGAIERQETGVEYAEVNGITGGCEPASHQGCESHS
jgi:hypothetical protein